MRRPLPPPSLCVHDDERPLENWGRMAFARASARACRPSLDDGRREYARLVMDGERSRLEADALMEMALAIASERPLVAVLHRLLDLVVELTGASRGAMIAIDADGSVRDAILSGPDGPLPSSATADVVRALLHDTRSSRLQGLELPSGSLGFPVDGPPVTSLIGS